MQGTYQQEALMGATALEQVMALYDGVIRFLHRAMQCCEENDVHGRRQAVKRAVDIIMYLQATLRPDVGGKAATALDEFYVAMFTMVLEASHYASTEQFTEVILCLRNVRDAWSIVAKDPAANKALPRELRTREEKFVPGVVGVVEVEQGVRWSA